MSGTRPLAVVTGASSGIGFELASICAEEGFDLVVGENLVVVRGDFNAGNVVFVFVCASGCCGVSLVVRHARYGSRRR